MEWNTLNEFAFHWHEEVSVVLKHHEASDLRWRLKHVFATYQTEWKRHQRTSLNQYYSLQRWVVSVLFQSKESLEGVSRMYLRQVLVHVLNQSLFDSTCVLKEITLIQTNKQGFSLFNSLWYDSNLIENTVLAKEISSLVNCFSPSNNKQMTWLREMDL